MRWSVSQTGGLLLLGSYQLIDDIWRTLIVAGLLVIGWEARRGVFTFIAREVDFYHCHRYFVYIEVDWLLFPEFPFFSKVCSAIVGEKKIEKPATVQFESVKLGWLMTMVFEEISRKKFSVEMKIVPGVAQLAYKGSSLISTNL